MKKIKLVKETLGIFKESDELLIGIVSLIRRQVALEEKGWANLYKQYPKLNFDSAKVDLETNTLILPFENYKDKGGGTK